jgi:hypothetical protein
MIKDTIHNLDNNPYSDTKLKNFYIKALDIINKSGNEKTNKY